MFKRVFGFLVFALVFLSSQCWAAPKAAISPLVAPAMPVSCEEGCSITNTFSPGNTTGIYDFSDTGNGILQVSFKTVLTTIMLKVTISNPTSVTTLGFPEGTVCVDYPFNGGQCTQYGFSANKGGPNGDPVKNVDYRGLISVILKYDAGGIVHEPAFGHAPGASTTFSENILTNYSQFPVCINCEPTMNGSTPGLSSVIALDEPGGTDTVCIVSPQLPATFQVGDEIEVAFRLFASGGCPTGVGNPLKDKDARLSVVNSAGVFQNIRDLGEGNKFHFDKDDGTNEREIDTDELLPDTYTVTLFSDEFSPVSFQFTLTPCTPKP